MRKSEHSYVTYYALTEYFIGTQQFASVWKFTIVATQHTSNMAAVTTVDRMTSLLPHA